MSRLPALAALLSLLVLAPLPALAAQPEAETAIAAAEDTANAPPEQDLGKLQISATYGPDGPRVEKDVSFEIRRPSTTEGEDGEWITAEYKPISHFELPSGTYEIVISVGAAKRTFKADISSAAPTKLDVNLDAGVLGLQTEAASEIEIVEAERDINNERHSVHIVYEPKLNVALNAGSYVAVVGYPDGIKLERPFSVVAGKRVELEIKK